MRGPLEHIRVLDLTIARAGPMAVRLLADWGADVIKIEPPPRKDAQGNSVTGGRRGPDEQNLHRNKRSLAIDLKREGGKALFHRLAKDADVVVENFRSSVKYRLGVDYDTLKAINPGLVYASISGFGQDGPDSERPGVDQIVQGMSGLMSITGEPEQGPMRVGIAISDTSAGMFLGQGILLALLHRERTGEGQWVHTSLLEAMMSKLDFQGSRYTMNGEEPTQQGNDHPTQVPMGMFNAKDGHVNIAAFGGQMWQRFCDALNAKALLQHPDYQSIGSRTRHRHQVKADMNAITESFTVTELVQRLNDAGVPCGSINTIKEAFENPQVQHLGMAVPAPHEEMGDLNLVRSPINLSSFPHPASLRRAAPDTGADGEEVLRGLGFAAEEITALQKAGVID
ncbi:MAG TPA: formyl-CoA transferase [Gammaproteobacteria bacterium]|jgi:crotonobetainyl-CoA:carnitine CoA-transferase CaiB-like acyl-CoA transferase|nr:formyl-CoA transferase [Gammaproteobacteria bacterium]|tara:strand:+ start:4812 stop:6002 length:1191 start_codon:yes stop_codon:yes gene_type:complete